MKARDEDDCMSSVSFVSWATDVTKCSNPAFRSVISHSWKNPSLQQDVMAVLTGITKLIHDKGGSESAAEYYAALLTALNISSTTKAAESYLLKIIICRAVPDTLLRSTFGEGVKIIVNLLGSLSATEHIATFKSLIICLGRLLRSQTRACWSLESVRHVYRQLLGFIDFPKPILRKSSHMAVLDILTYSPDETESEIREFHPACHQTVDHLCRIINQEKLQLTSVLNTEEIHCTRLLHCLELLTNLLHLLPSKEVKTACECLLELLEFPNPLVVSKAFSSFQSLFDSHPTTECVSVELGARLLTALHTFRPNDPVIFDVPGSSNVKFSGLDVMLSWIRAVRAGCAHLCDLCCKAMSSTAVTDCGNSLTSNKKYSLHHLTVEHLDRLIKTLFELLLMSARWPKLRKMVSNHLDGLLVIELDILLGLPDREQYLMPLLLSMARKLNDCLDFKHYEIWINVLSISARLLRSWHRLFDGEIRMGDDLCDLIRRAAYVRDGLVDGPRAIINLLSNTVSSTSNVAVVDDRLGELVIDELDRFVQVALESLGPEITLSESLLPLEPIIGELEKGVIELRRSWILPILPRCRPANPCHLGLFVRSILPLADRALAIASHAPTMELPSSVSMNVLITAGVMVAKQLWSSVAMFVHHAPLDWSVLSSGFGRRLVTELTNASALRPVILLVLRRLARAAISDEVGLTAMRGGAKLAIPTLLSLYETSELPRDAALQQQLRSTLSAYLFCLTPKMIHSPTALSLEKLENTSNPVYLELLQILVPHTSVEDIGAFLPKLNVFLSPSTSPSKVLRKRAYRLLELICCCSTESSSNFVDKNLDFIITLLHDHSPATSVGESLITPVEERLSQLSVSAVVEKRKKIPILWKPRLRCLYHLLTHLAKSEHALCADQTSTEVGAVVDSERLRNFANMFLPEILSAVCVSNRAVQDLAYKFVLQLVMAFAGQSSLMPDSMSAALRSEFDGQSVAISSRRIATSDDEEEDDGDEDDDDDRSSLGRFTSVDDDDVRSTLSMSRGSVVSLNICASLHLIMSRLWACLPPHSPAPTNNSELTMHQATARVVCYLLKHQRCRRALLFSSESDCMQSQLRASQILSEANLAAKSLVPSPYRPLAECGLQIIRSMLIFVGHSLVSLIDLVSSLQSLNASQKRPLRFAVKAILEKMITKFGRNVIQPMMNAEYQKVVRNSARVMARQERHQLTLNSIKEVDESDDAGGATSMKSGQTVSRKHSPTDTQSLTARSQLSLPPRLHTFRFEDLLAASSEDEHPIQHNAASIRSGKSSEPTRKSKRSVGRQASLVEELESVAETSGLCRRARKSVLRSGSATSGPGDSDGESAQTFELGTTRTGIRRRVRFSDATSVATTSHLMEPKRRRGQTENKNSSDLWLIEQPDSSDIVDLSDPRALARHTAFAADAETARAMTQAMQKRIVSRDKPTAPTSSPFPIVDGKLIIDGGKKDQNLTNATDWDYNDSEDDGENMAVKKWSSQQPTSTKFKLARKSQLPGQLYASAKARGDMRRSGQPDPYAFVKLGSGLGDIGAGKTTPLERKRLLRAIGVGKRKRHKQEDVRQGGRRNKISVVRNKLKRVRR